MICNFNNTSKYFLIYTRLLHNSEILMLLISFRNLTTMNTLLGRVKQFLLMKPTVIFKYSTKKPTLENKITWTFNLRKFNLPSLFNLKRHEKFFFSSNLHKFKRYYRVNFLQKKLHKPTKILSFGSYFGKITRITTLRGQTTTNTWLKSGHKKLNLGSLTSKNLYINTQKYFIFKNYKKHKLVARVRFFQYDKVSFFKKTKNKYKLRRKKKLNKKLLNFYDKLKYYSIIKSKLRLIFLSNFKNKRLAVKRSLTKHKRVNYKLNKSIKNQILRKFSYLILPKIIFSRIKLDFTISNSQRLPRIRSTLTSNGFLNKPSYLLNLFVVQGNKFIGWGRQYPKITNILLKTRHKCSFIIQNVGLVFPIKLLYKHKAFDLYKIKKKMLSFIKKNEYKSHIFNSRKKYVLWKNFFYNQKNFMVQSSSTNFKFFKDEFSLSSKNFNKKLYTFNFIDNLFFLKNNFFYSRLKNINNSSNEVRVQRIRFKPGYQRLWRGFRLALSELINYKFLYQQQLTKYLTKFYRKLNQNYVSNSENSIDKVIIYSKLLPDNNSLNSFFNHNMIFVNGVRLTNLSLYVYKNDFIQLEISNWYYVFSRWLVQLTKNRNSKLKRLIFKKGMSSRYKLMKQTKQRSNYTPNWILNTRYDFQDIKSFIEVDFFTLSLFVIYDHNYFLYYTPIEQKSVPYSIYKMYNWKYVT